MGRFRNVCLSCAVVLASTGFAGAADTAKKQLERAPRQSGNVTFDGARNNASSNSNSGAVNAGSSTTRRTQEQAIKDYRDSSRTTPEQQRAIERYRNSGKSRPGQ
jgi:hypothetical protein